uniref:CCHC-type domain-containing protein n=1 Tax=Tanacetum cinerariifolium TaxID=118510 RepID=A0A6L2NJX0_TANCI|nr:hypothetical protein [Tanacetum cinerariifolium]
MDMIHGRVRASKRKTMEDAIEIVTKLRNKKISTLVECQTANKKRLITLLRTIRTNDSRTRGKTLAELTLQGMGRRNITLDLSRCVLNETHHDGTGASQKATCYECGKQGPYKRDCPERKNQNHENQIKSTKARGVVHAFREGETVQDLNNIEDDIEA